MHQYSASSAHEKGSVRKWLQLHRGSLQAWGVLVCAAILIYYLFSDGDFSFCLTLSSLVACFSFLMVIIKIERSKSAAGVSLKMMECYVVLQLARLCSIIPYEGYLPFDRSGDWLYQTIEAVSFLLAAAIVYACRFRHAATYDARSDSFVHLFLIVPVAIMALVLHPSLNDVMGADVAWTFALYLESVACLPQLFMFQKERKVEAFTTHFLAGQALSKVLQFVFWASSHSELNDETKPLKSYIGVWVMVMQGIQLVLMGDFIYHYVRCLSRGVPVEYILSQV